MTDDETDIDEEQADDRAGAEPEGRETESVGDDTDGSDAGETDDIDWAKIEDRGETDAGETDAGEDEPFPTPADSDEQSATGAAEHPVSEETLKGMEGTFEEMDADGVGADEVWADVADEEGMIPDETEDDVADDEGMIPDETEDDVADDEGEMVPDETEDDVADEEGAGEEEIADADIAEVSKHDYCERCEHFSRAPEIHCTHDGTEILDFTDMASVRVANCPVVAERKGLEQGIAKGGTQFGEIQRE